MPTVSRGRRRQPLFFGVYSFVAKTGFPPHPEKPPKKTGISLEDQ